MAGTAGEALAAPAVETIARGGGLVAGRAGGHRPTLPPAPHDFADSSKVLNDVEVVLSTSDQSSMFVAQLLPPYDLLAE